MKFLLKFFSLLLFFGAISTVNSISAQVRPYRVTDRQVQTLLNRIETNTDIYKRQMNTALDQSKLNGSDTEDVFFGYVSDFENTTDALKQNFDARRSAGSDVEDVLNRASQIDQFMRRNRLTTGVQRIWTSIRTDLNTLATYYQVTPNWNGGGINPTPNTNPTPNNTGGMLPYRVTDNNVRTLLARLETRTDAYKREVNTALDKSVLNNTRSENQILTYISDFENSTDSLKRKFDSRSSVGADVEDVLNRAYYIDGFMRDYRLTAGAESQWRLIRTDLDTLSNYYNVSWNWNRQYSPAGTFDTRLTGTYRLNVDQSDNVTDIVGRSISSYPVNQQDRFRRNLERRLTSPDTLAIDKRGKQVTIVSSNSPQVTFDADGVARTEANANGRSTKITATTNYDGIALSYEGDRSNDFYVNFNQLGSNQLRVVRRVYLENKNDTITVASVYDKISETADLTVNGNTNTGSTNANINDFIIANNTPVTAVLKTPVSTKVSQNNDRFQMEVRSPSQYDGAIIEGRVASTERSGRVSGRANISLEFDTIRLRNGQTYRFAGIVNSVKLPNGENVTVNNEGAVRDNNQTTKTVTRAGIGAAIGSIIGAIAGGGSGAAIGAGVGAGAGAGSVVLQGRDDVELGEGSEFSITASAPNNVNR